MSWKDAKRIHRSMELASVKDNARRLATSGKGILASDESPSTIGKRLEKYGIENTIENRGKYRSLFYTAPGLGGAISGAILFPETLLQQSDDGTSFVDSLTNEGILVGVKVDEGLEPLKGGYEGETRTKGMETLEDRCRQYKEQGAVFAKWRAAIRICDVDGQFKCSKLALEVNADELAEYAAICQKVGLTPLVEPEILIDGAYSIDVAEQTAKSVLATCMQYLWKREVDLAGILLKPQMVVPGIECSERAEPAEIASRTIRVLRQTVPPAVPGIMFLSGGQSEAQATENLNMLNVLAKSSKDHEAPWSLSFSFGRALQASVLSIWSTKGAGSEDECKEMALKIALANGAATRGCYALEKHPSILAASGSLQETFRGWRPSVSA